MTARTAGHAPVGSTEWISKEFNEISALCENELEDFTFSARNEVEWLNEHMADVFSSSNFNLAELMKTPGKLRGKTPRTIQQRSPFKEVRQPLGEIAPINRRFNSPLRQSPAKSPVKLEPSEERLAPALTHEPIKIDRATKDSGYHGDSDDMDMERELPATQDLELIEEEQSNRNETVEMSAINQGARQEEGRSTEGSFHSAKENQTLKGVPEDVEMHVGHADDGDIEAERVSEQLRRESADQTREGTHEPALQFMTDARATVKDEEVADASSEGSTPNRAVVRKSSLNFAALPAREPLATKKSMGNRVSGNNSGFTKSGYFQRITGGKSLGAALHSDDDNEDDDEQENVRQDLTRNEPRVIGTAVGISNNTSTAARLHERISAMNKTKAPRPTKSIPSAPVAGQPDYSPISETAPNVSNTMQTQAQPSPNQEHSDNEDEPWISNTEATVSRPLSVPEEHGAESEGRRGPQSEKTAPLPFQIHQDEPIVEQRSSTTPAGSPPKHLLQHGPVNASKSKLQSLMQTARGLFSSSAAASAQAKLEASSITSPSKDKLQPHYPILSQGKGPLADTIAEPRRTRSSTEKEEKKKREEQEENEAQHQQYNNSRDEPDELAGAHVKQQSKQVEQHDSHRGVDEEQDELVERPQTAMGPPARPRTIFSKTNANKRPLVKHMKDQPTQHKVSIKIGSMANRRPLTAATLSTASKGQDTAAQPRPGVAGKKESNVSRSTTGSSAPSFKSSTTSTIHKPKALLAAERKKEADQKAAQKKLEQKRELERRKVAQQEETQRRDQERQAAERQNERDRQAEEERKRQEQRQAVERKRAEQLAKREQMQREAEQQALKASAYRNEAGSVRPPSRQATLQDFPRPPGAQPQTNGNKGSKRIWNPEQDEEQQRIDRPQTTQNYRQIQDGKRRKTDDEDTFDEGPRRPTMAPPVRISNILKNGPKTSVFGNYPRAPPPATHHHSGVSQQAAPFKQSYGAQGPPARPGTAMDIARFQSGTIPFASSQAPGPTPHAGASAPFKTPLQASKYGQPQTQPPQPKSSPFINGEYVQLDDIPTDSDSEDSEDERERKANMPDWVLTPNLQQTLMDQEAQNPDAVFGPIAPLNMNDIFKDAQARQRLRNRTSSANWFGADRLSEEEKVRDLEAREKMRQDGGWSFGL